MKIPFLGSKDQRPGIVDLNSQTRITTPWAERWDDAVYVGLAGDIWMYRVLDNMPLRFENDSRILDHGRSMAQCLTDIGRTSVASPTGGFAGGLYRQIHIMTIRWQQRPAPPGGTPTKALQEYLRREILTFVAPVQRLFIGIQLTDIDAAAAARSRSAFDLAAEMLDTVFGDSLTNADRFEKDRDFLHGLLLPHGGRIPDPEERAHLEAWINYGAHTEPEILVYKDHLMVDRTDRIEFSAVESFQHSQMMTPHNEWLADMMDHGDGPSVVSIRGELQPPVDTRRQLRKSVRARRSARRDEVNANQVERVEEIEEDQLASHAEAQFSRADAAPSLRNTSIIMGRRDNGEVDEPLHEYLRHRYAIETRPLIHHQLQAWEETMPCGRRRASKFRKHLDINMVAYAGIGAYTELGDDQGCILGRGLPDNVPVYWDPLQSSVADSPPVTAILGIPGSGKTFTALHLSLQAAMSGLPVVFLNPKGGDSLYPMVEFMAGEGIKTEHVAISKLARDGQDGIYDPFRYAETPETAADLCSSLILTLLPDFTQLEKLDLKEGMLRGARQGAGCLIQALEAVNSENVRRQVMALWTSTPLFALVAGATPRGRMASHETDAEDRGRFILAEFDVPLDIPYDVDPNNYNDGQKLAVAVLRAVTLASVGMLAGSRGGMFVQDEAHVVLGNAQTLNMLTRLMREGRSLNIAQLYLTQLVSDLVSTGDRGSSLESFITRVLAMRMTDPVEAAAALRLVGLDATPERIADMKDFGPKKLPNGQRQPALGFYRDLTGRRSLIALSGGSREFRLAASTNINDKRLREQVAAASPGESS
jgi:hypothetical protein